MIPRNTIEKAPSAELRPGQKDTDSLPDYDILDAILHLYLEDRKGYEEIIAQGFDKNTVERVLKLVNNAEYKRFQAAPLLKISPKAFGVGRRFPIVSRFHL